MATRDLTIKIEPSTGTFNRIIAWVNGYPAIHTDGEAGEWTGKISDGKVKLETAIWGQGAAKYTLAIDLPGTLNDQKFECTLTNGYQDAEYTI
jgi:hypothetical protein